MWQDIVATVDTSQRSLYVAVASIVFNPTFWNIVARRQYRTGFLVKYFNGDRYLACYALGLTIFVLGLVRDWLYDAAVSDQPVTPYLDTSLFQGLAVVCFLAGNLLVLSSMWALGITGTYLGDYCGILMDAPVTSFPFNLLNNPMYDGSTLTFLSIALYRARMAGVLLTLLVFVCYRIAIAFEGPFTTEIYKNRDRQRQAKAQAAASNSSRSSKSSTNGGDSPAANTRRRTQQLK